MSRPLYFTFCGFCGAEPRKPCRTMAGKVTDTHYIRTSVRARGSVHSADRCAGQWCVLHNPSDHHMRDWKLVSRFDKLPPIFERVCSHGVGHPDPDSAAWAQRVVVEQPMVWQGEISDGSYVWIHGCCINEQTGKRCCAPPEEEGQP